MHKAHLLITQGILKMCFQRAVLAKEDKFGGREFVGDKLDLGCLIRGNLITRKDLGAMVNLNLWRRRRVLRKRDGAQFVVKEEIRVDHNLSYIGKNQVGKFIGRNMAKERLNA